MSKRMRAGGYGARQKDGKKRPRSVPAPPTPLEFALTLMRDETQTPAVRASMAKLAAALSDAQSVAQAPPAPEDDAMQWSDLELARRIAHILMLADREQEEKNRSAEEKTRPRSDGQEETREKARAVAPVPVTHIASHEPAPALARSPSQHAAQVLPDQVLPDQVLPDDERGRGADDPFDPHPGYRWIP